MNRSPPTSMGPPAGAGLARYGSAPGSLLASVADSVVGAGAGYSAAGSEGMMSRFYRGDSSCLSAESSCKAVSTAASATAPADLELYGGSEPDRSYGLGEIPAGDPTAGMGPKGGEGGTHPLMRHSSSPAGFFSNLLLDNGFSVTRGIGNFSQAGLDAADVMASRRLKSQLSFSGQESLSQFSKISIPETGESIGGVKSSDEVTGQSFISSNFPVTSWDDTDSIVFSAPNSKRAKDNNGDIITSFGNIESPQFSLPKEALAIAAEDDFFQFHQDSVPFKVRAKRGFATHPRSIAERERRTRISERLKKLQELVPNMDKQTNTADMLDLAVQHIKGLQSKVQRLNEERENCTCEGSKR